MPRIEMLEDSPYKVEDPSFDALISGNARVWRLWSGAAWTEGPVWFGDMNCLLFSDIPNDRILRFTPHQTGMNGDVSVFRQPANFTNGHTRDRQGRLVSCEHGGRRVSRTEHDGTITVLADRWNGKRLNSPNDVVVKSDGTVWFSDPPYGILTDLEGHKGEMEYGACHLFRIDTEGSVHAVATDFVKPNGLCFSPDEKTLYVADTGVSHDPNGPKHIRRFDVQSDNSLSGGEVFAECDEGVFDGFRCDAEGRIWTSAGDGVHCYTPQGQLLGRILIPEVVANVAFGGPKRNRLYICGTSSLYAVHLNVNGALKP